MTSVSLTHAAQLLGIDGKTLQHWLAHAQFTPHPDPRDARKKGLSQQQVEQLARLHQRHLPWTAEPPSPSTWSASPLPSAFPDEVLALLGTLAEVPAQMTALQASLGVLTQRVEHALPASPVPVVRRKKPAERSIPPRQVKPPAKPTQVLARVEYTRQGHYVVWCPTHGRLPFEPDSREWVGWLMGQTAFRFVGQQGHLTAHRQANRLYPQSWRAHRTIRNRTHNLPLAHSQDLTIALLEQAAATFQAHLT